VPPVTNLGEKNDQMEKKLYSRKRKTVQNRQMPGNFHDKLGTLTLGSWQREKNVNWGRGRQGPEKGVGPLRPRPCAKNDKTTGAVCVPGGKQNAVGAVGKMRTRALEPICFSGCVTKWKR